MLCLGRRATYRYFSSKTHLYVLALTVVEAVIVVAAAVVAVVVAVVVQL